MMLVMEVSVDYKITYTAYRGEERCVMCNNFEDAEKIAAFIAQIPLVQYVVLSDGDYETHYGEKLPAECGL